MCFIGCQSDVLFRRSGTRLKKREEKEQAGLTANLSAKLVGPPSHANGSSSFGELAIPEDLSTAARVASCLRRLIPALGAHDPLAAVVPWLCDKCPSEHSRRAYLGDLATFLRHFSALGVHPLEVTADHVALYKESLSQAGKKPTTICRVLSVIRGAYQQFGRKGLVDWKTVGDIQAVESPRVKKNTTPALTEQEARNLLHTPDTKTLIGCRDHALLFTYIMTTCRASAVAHATVGSLDRSGADWFLTVTEKGSKEERKALIDASSAVLAWVERAGIADKSEFPLFPPIGRDGKSVEDRHLTTHRIRNIVKKYARLAGIQVVRPGRRAVCTHSLRKTSITSALNNGATMQQAKSLAGHSSIRTTELYYQENEKDAEEAAKRIQIR
ncbi:Tyrosine recombinase XerD [Planctomycetes bacterium K2D]|uniref:Tyrosine recombinase XerD n=1 Tax=Botrimarina mediterranea TaxID=2528022 RepID=A0A518K7B3_9BACT|nr:Tyrosine recombinase XerD [Botrimarina mediterranea]QDV78265.1 Tyrosine recombinase XerD [Planctomycetes bacterium K2D]